MNGVLTSPFCYHVLWVEWGRINNQCCRFKLISSGTFWWLPTEIYDSGTITSLVQSWRLRIASNCCSVEPSQSFNLLVSLNLQYKNNYMTEIPPWCLYVSRLHLYNRWSLDFPKSLPDSAYWPCSTQSITKALKQIFFIWLAHIDFRMITSK